MQGNFPFDQFLVNSNTNNSSILNNLEDSNTSDNNNLSSMFSPDELSSMNTEILNGLKSTVSAQKYDAFFSQTFKLVDIQENKAIFSVPTNFIKTMIEKHVGEISASIQSVLGRPYVIEITLETNSTPNSQSTQGIEITSKPQSAKEISFSLNLEQNKEDMLSKVNAEYINHIDNNATNGILIDENKTFKNFIIGPSNNLAHAAAVAITKNPGKSGKYPSLYMHSNSGLGKTHLLHAIANGINENYPHYVICLITARDFMKEMIEAMKDNKIHEFRDKYSNKLDILMIDDIHEIKGKEGTQREFFHIFNELYHKGKQLIFTSDKTPQEINGLEDRIKTRLQWGLVVDIQKPDIETRVAIIKRKADELDLYISDDIINLIACNIKNSIRELEGALISLAAYADIMKVDIDLETVKNVLSLNHLEEERNISLETIAKATSQYFKIPLPDLKSKARKKEIANARFVAMYLSRKLLYATHEEIGKFYSRDHSSVVHAEQRITERLEHDSQLSRHLITIENSL